MYYNPNNGDTEYVYLKPIGLNYSSVHTDDGSLMEAQLDRFLQEQGLNGNYTMSEEAKIETIDKITKLIKLGIDPLKDLQFFVDEYAPVGSKISLFDLDYKLLAIDEIAKAAFYMSNLTFTGTQGFFTLEPIGLASAMITPAFQSLNTKMANVNLNPIPATQVEYVRSGFNSNSFLNVAGGLEVLNLIGDAVGFVGSHYSAFKNASTEGLKNAVINSTVNEAVDMAYIALAGGGGMLAIFALVPKPIGALLGKSMVVAFLPVTANNLTDPNFFKNMAAVIKNPIDSWNFGIKCFQVLFKNSNSQSTFSQLKKAISDIKQSRLQRIKSDGGITDWSDLTNIIALESWKSNGNSQANLKFESSKSSPPSDFPNNFTLGELLAYRLTMGEKTVQRGLLKMSGSKSSIVKKSMTSLANEIDRRESNIRKMRSSIKKSDVGDNIKNLIGAPINNSKIAVSVQNTNLKNPNGIKSKSSFSPEDLSNFNISINTNTKSTFGATVNFYDLATFPKEKPTLSSSVLYGNSPTDYLGSLTVSNSSTNFSNSITAFLNSVSANDLNLRLDLNANLFNLPSSSPSLLFNGDSISTFYDLNIDSYVLPSVTVF